MLYRLGLAFVCALSLAQLASGEDELRKAVDSITKRTIQLMDERGLKSLTILGVEDGTTYGATAASGIERMLKDQFAAAGRLKDSFGDVGLRGRILTAKQSNPKPPPEVEAEPAPEAEAVSTSLGFVFTTSSDFVQEGKADVVEDSRKLKIELVLTDMDGEALTTLDGEYFLDRLDQDSVNDNTRLGRDGRKKDPLLIKSGKYSEEIEAPEAILMAFGANGEVNSKTLKAPQSVISNGNVAKVSKESLFGVRISTRKGVRPLRMVDGRPFVDLEKGEEFAIEVLSSAKEHVSAMFAVDGLNTFYFSKTPKIHGSSWIISPSSTAGQATKLALEGWYVRQGIADKFVATDFANSKRKSANLGETPIGAISVLFSSAIHLKDIERTEKRTEKVKVLSVDGEEVETEIVQDQKVVVPNIYIGGSGEVKQHEGGPASYKPNKPLEIVTIRYRHPSP